PVSNTSTHGVRQLLEHFSPLVLPRGSNLNLDRYTLWKDDHVDRGVPVDGMRSAVDDLRLAGLKLEQLDDACHGLVLFPPVRAANDAHWCARGPSRPPSAQ